MANKEKKLKRKFRIYEKCFKRLIDFVGALILLIVLSPIMLVISIISLFAVGRPVVFSQYRPGKNGKVFKLYKFRSMSYQKDKNGQLLSDKERVTKFGKFLRKSGLDEMLQLINILKGDMSFVGPRPRLVKDLVFYDEESLKAYRVRPGIAGLAQYRGGRTGCSWEDVFKHDIEYAENVTFLGDLKIIFKTIFSIVKKEWMSSDAGEPKREYYYPDYLLKTGQITKDQYNKGLAHADEIIEKKGTVVFQQNLHKKKKE